MFGCLSSFSSDISLSAQKRKRVGLLRSFGRQMHTWLRSTGCPRPPPPAGSSSSPRSGQSFGSFPCKRPRTCLNARKRRFWRRNETVASRAHSHLRQSSQSSGSLPSLALLFYVLDRLRMQFCRSASWRWGYCEQTINFWDQLMPTPPRWAHTKPMQTLRTIATNEGNGNWFDFIGANSLQSQFCTRAISCQLKISNEWRPLTITILNVSLLRQTVNERIYGGIGNATFVRLVTSHYMDVRWNRESSRVLGGVFSAEEYFGEK